MSEAVDVIAQVHVEDVERARALIHSAIERAAADWLPVDAIADALVLETLATWTRCRPAGALAPHMAAVTAISSQHARSKLN